MSDTTTSVEPEATAKQNLAECIVVLNQMAAASSDTVQQTVLRAAYDRLIEKQYRCLYANPEHWPAAFIFVNHDYYNIAIIPLPNDFHAESILPHLNDLKDRFSGEYMAFVFVGDLPVSHPSAQKLLHTLKTPSAYIDAQNRRYIANKKKSFFRSTIVYPLHKCCQATIRNNADTSAKSQVRLAVEQKIGSDIKIVQENASFEKKARAASKSNLLAAMIIVAACVGMFVVQKAVVFSTTGGFSGSLQNYIDIGALYAPAVKAGQWWRLVSCAFLHGGIMHLILNMAALMTLYEILDLWQGWRRIMIIYFFSIVAGSIASLYFLPDTVSVGASGGIFGLFGAIAATLLMHRKNFPPHAVTAMKKWFGTNALIAILISFLPFVNGYAHLGGFLAGLLMGLAIFRQPARVQPMTVFQWSAMFGLLTATAAFGTHVINFRM